jgi:hypothetical protein
VILYEFATLNIQNTYKCPLISFDICYVHDKIKENEISRACMEHGIDEKYIQFVLSNSLKETIYLEDLGGDGKVILR